MQALQHSASRVASRPAPCSQRRVHHHMRLGVRLQAQSGRSEPFNEGAVQVKRLVDRDRLQMLGNKIDILDKFETEFGDPSDEAAATSTSARPAAASAAAAVADAAAAASTSSSSGAPAAAPSAAPPAAAAAAPPAAAKPAAPAAVKTNFGGSGGVASPFGAPGASSRTRSMMEPKGLSPDMGPDPIVKTPPTPGNLISKITLTQVVLFCTFSSMIGLMLATFSVVVKSGAVRLAGIE